MLQGERIKVFSFASMLRSVAYRLYMIDSSIIEDMAGSEEKLYGWVHALFSYNPESLTYPYHIKDINVYMSTGYSPAQSIQL